MVSFEDHFSGQAADYARHRPDYPADLFTFLSGLAPHRRRAWDCATGNGQAALALAGHFEEVVATDASIRQIREAARRRGVRYAVASAEEPPLRNESVALVTAAQALHWFDRPRFWKEVRRVLAPGGAIAVWAYHGFHATPEIEEALDRYYKEIVGPYWPAGRGIVEQGYGALEFPFAEEPPPPFLLEKQWDFAALFGYLGTWSATGRYREANGSDPRLLVREELAEAWGEPERVRPFRWDLDLRVGRKE